MGLFDFFRKKPAGAAAPAGKAELAGKAEPTELDAPVPEGQRRLVVRRFENERDGIVFFREVTLDGCAVRHLNARAPKQTPREPSEVFDRVGERFETPALARAHFERLVEEAEKSYQRQMREDRLVPQGARGGGAASNPELERAFEQAGEAEAATTAQVLADWLQEKGDPRGECAALFQQGRGADAKAFLEVNAEALLGKLDVKLDSEIYDLVWDHGFLKGASLKRRDYAAKTDLAELTRDFLALPLARFVTRLRFGLASYESDNDWTETLRAAVESPRGPHLRELRFDDYQSEDCEISWAAFGDFSSFWPKLPALEYLHLRSGAGGTLGEIDLPNLKTFIRESGGLGAEEIQSIVRARWPRLERLDVWLGSEDYGAEGTVEMLRPLLDGGVPKSLKHLGLVNCEFAPDLLKAVLDSKVLPQLEVLDLSKGILVDADVEVLFAQADRVRHLKRLDLSENLLHASLERLREALPNVVVDDQRFEEGEEEYRFTAVGE